jgi:hypothetical protein
MNGRRWRLGAMVALGLVVMLAAPLTTLASGGPPPAGGATVSIGSTKVIGKVIAEIQVQVVCQPLPTFDEFGQPTTTEQGSVENGFVNLQQAQGRVVASGSGEFFGGVICDGSTLNSFTVDIPATTYPWKAGTAVVSAGVFITDPAFDSFDSGSTGAVLIKLGK